MTDVVEQGGSVETTRVKPLWRRIIEFPLVAMLLGIVTFFAGFAVVGIVVVLIGLAAGLTTVAGLQSPDGIPDWLGTHVAGLLLALMSVIIAKVVLRRLGEDKRDELPFDARSFDFFRGIGLAFLLMSAIVAVAALLGGYSISGWGGSTSWPFLFLVTGFQAAFFEEILFRGVIFRFLEEFAGSIAALLWSGLIFGLVHYSNPNGTLFASLAIAVEAGILLGGAYMLTRNLWLAIGVHWGWNVTQGYVWDVPVSGIDGDGMLEAHPVGSELISGGAFGLEASLVALVLATTVGIILVAKAYRRGHFVSPWWVRRAQAGSAAVQPVGVPASTVD